MKRILLFNKEAYWTNVYSSTHSTVYSYIANSTNSIYSISNRLSSALVSATLSITVSLLIDMRISFSVHINMKASKLSWLNELRSLFFTNFKVDKLFSHATCVMDKVNRNLYDILLFLTLNNFNSYCLLCYPLYLSL